MNHNDSFPNCSSESTSVTDSTVTSTTTGEVTGWNFGFKEITGIARCLKESIPPAIDNFAEKIHKSAMNIAAEFSELEKQIQRESEEWLEQNQFGEDSELTATSTEGTKSSSTDEKKHNQRFIIPLPWEIPFSSSSHSKENDDNSSDDDKKTSLHQLNEYQEDSILKEKILQLSKNEDTFLSPFGKKLHPQNAKSEDDLLPAHFILDDDHIDLIRRLLIIDDNLTKMHARMRAHDGIKENIFWRNYFYHCDLVRESHINEYDDVSTSDDKSQQQNIPKKEEVSKNNDKVEIFDDGELVEAPPASCTGYYTRSQNPSLQHDHSEDLHRVQRVDNTRTLSSDSLVLVGTSEEELKAALL